MKRPPGHFPILIFLLVFYAQWASADTVELRNGRVISGEIIRETQDIVIIRSRAAKRSTAYAIRRSNIRAIKHIDLPEQKKGKAQEEPIIRTGNERRPFFGFPSGDSYYDHERGFYFNGPYGWIKHPAPPIDGVHVLFNMSESPKRIFPGIALSVDDLGNKADSLEDFARGVIDTQETSGSRLVEQVAPILIHGTPGLKFVTESPAGRSGGTFRLMHILFKKNDKAISIMCIAKAEDFDQYLEAFEESISSFRLTSP